MLKKREPTSIKTSNLVTAVKKIDNQKDDDPLEKKFDSLQKWWEEYIQQSNSRTNPRHSTTDSSAIVSGDLLQLLDNSPKSLMASLQHTESPSPSQGWSLFNSRKLDRAAVEVIKEREAAFENGRFKGRRLFEETELGLDDKQEISSDLVQESEVPTVIFSEPIHLSETEESGISCVGVTSVNIRRKAYHHGENFMNGGNCDQCRHCSRLSHPVSDGGGGTEVAEERENMAVDNIGHCNGGGMAVYGGRWMIKMAWAGIMLLTLGIVAIKCRGGEDEFTLVPT